MSQVNVTINGKIYRIACDDGQESHLNTLAARLDRTIGDLRGAFGEIGDQRLTVMAAIMVMDEASETERRLAALEAERASNGETRAALDQRRTGFEAALAVRIDHAADRLEQLASALTGRTQVN